MKRYINHNYFDVLGANQYYLLGFFAADGNSEKTSKSGYTIRWQLKDLELVKKIKKEFDSEHKITTRCNRGRKYYGIAFASS